MDPFAFVTVVTLIAGAGGTGIGGAVGALFKTESNKIISLLLALAGGVMTAMVCFELLAESINAAQDVAELGVLLVIGAVALGVAVVYGLNNLIDRKTRGKVSHTAEKDHPDAHDDIDELIHADNYNQEFKKHGSGLSLLIAGVVMAAAIALHNVPEGMTIGASFSISDNLLLGTGMVMAVLIGLHNIPEGMAVSVPLINGGMGRLKAVLITAACGLPTTIGAWLGLWFGDIGSFGLCMSLGFASGAMLYVVFGEIMPEAYLICRSKTPAFAFMGGLAVGLLIINL